MLSRLERSILGLLIIGVLSNGMILLGIPEFYQMLAKRLVLIAAVGMDTYMRRTYDETGNFQMNLKHALLHERRYGTCRGYFVSEL